MKIAALLCFASLLVTTGSRQLFAQGPVVVTSPDHKVQAELMAGTEGLRYRVLVDGRQVVASSALGIRTNNVELGDEARLGLPERRVVDETYRLFGTHALARNDASEASVSVTSHGQSYHVDMHVADDGVAFRLRLPATADRKVQADRSAWKLPGDPQMWVESWDPGYENLYRSTSLRQLGSGALSLPITARVGNLYLTLSEAGLKSYGDLAVQPGPDGTLQGKLLNDADGWTTSDEVIQPWRVTIIGRSLTALVNSTLVPSLNPPARKDLVDASWIKPGRSTWQWLAIGDPREEDQNQWIDWTEQLGFEYYLIDEGWASWKSPWPGIAKASAYARQHHVKIWIWANSKEVKDSAQREEYFRKAVEAGVVGVKIDFPPPTNYWWSQWYWDVARDAAAHHLLVDFHGATKPTGMDRTWPNVLTREGVRGHEYHITRYQRLLPPEHDTILPFTRYVVGPGDYTPTVFEEKELKGNTWGHELAQAIVFTSPFLCFGGHPRDYLANSAKDVLTAIPATWDETVVLSDSEPGKVVAMARRSGQRWFVGVINGADAIQLNLSLAFLGKGRWSAVELFDVKDKPAAWNRQTASVSEADSIPLDLKPRGGFVMEVTKR